MTQSAGEGGEEQLTPPGSAARAEMSVEKCFSPQLGTLKTSLKSTFLVYLP